MAADVRAFDVATGNVPDAPGEARYGEHLEGHPRESRSPAGEALELRRRMRFDPAQATRRASIPDRPPPNPPGPTTGWLETGNRSTS